MLGRDFLKLLFLTKIVSAFTYTHSFRDNQQRLNQHIAGGFAGE